MPDLRQTLRALRRPRLLIRAARFGLAEYDRPRDLRRLLRRTTTPTPSRALAILLDYEAMVDELRRSGDVTYSPARHIELLVAIMGEARLLPRPAADQVKASGISDLRRATYSSSASRVPGSSAGA